MYNNENLTAEEYTTFNGKEVADYVYIKDGHGYEHKVFNLDSPKYAPFEGIVELIPTKYSKGFAGVGGSATFRHKPEITFRGYRDKATQALIGISIGVNQKTKDLEFQRITVQDVMFLDLSIPAERKKFICIKYSPFLEGSPNFNVTAKTTYKLVDKQKEADDFFAKRNTIKKAAEIAEGLVGEPLENFATALGFDPKLYSPTQLSMEVIKFAENTQKVNGKTGAERFMDAWNSDTRKELVILKRGLATNIVTESPTDGFMFNGVPLGLTEEEACWELKRKEHIAASIDTQARTKQSHSTIPTQAKAVIASPESDRIKELERQLQEQMRINRELNVANKVDKGGEDADAIEIEYKELCEEARKAGMKGPQLIGGKNKSTEEKILLLRKALNEHILQTEKM